MAENESSSIEHDMYVFARDTDPDLIANSTKDPSVRYVAQITGDYSSFAVIESDTVDVQRISNQLFAPTPTAPTSDPDTSKPIASGMFVLKKSLWLAESALMRIGVRAGVAEDVLRAADDLEGYSASSIVLGNYDILLELAADTRDELYRRILAATRLDGVAWTRTHLVLDWWHRDHPKDGAA